MAERRSVAADVVGSKPTSRPNLPSSPISGKAHWLKTRHASERQAQFQKSVPEPSLAKAPRAHSSPARPAGRTRRGSRASTRTDFRKEVPGFYASQLNSCEVNYTFRKLPSRRRFTSGSHRCRLVSLFVQGAAAHYALQPAARLPRACREFLRFVAARSRGRQARPAAVSASAQLQGQPAAAARLPRLQPRCVRPARRPSRSSSATKLVYRRGRNVLREHNAALCIAETEDFRSPELHTAVGHTSFACASRRRLQADAGGRLRRAHGRAARRPRRLRLLQA